MKACHFVMGFSMLSTIAHAGDLRAVSDVQSMVLRSDGQYDIICKNGTSEIATIEQIHHDSVCGGGCPAPSADVIAVFSRPQGDFFALCKDQAWEVATASMIQKGNVCSAVSPDSYLDLRTKQLWIASAGGTARGIGFLAKKTFSISELGFYAALPPQPFDITVYHSIDGHSAGNLLLNVVRNAGTGTRTWNDVPLNFTFESNHYYMINWRSTREEPGIGWASEFEYGDDRNLPFDIGPVRLLEGFEGDLNATNTLHPHFRFKLR